MSWVWISSSWGCWFSGGWAVEPFYRSHSSCFLGCVLYLLLRSALCSDEVQSNKAQESRGLRLVRYTQSFCTCVLYAYGHGRLSFMAHEFRLASSGSRCGGGSGRTSLSTSGDRSEQGRAWLCTRDGSTSKHLEDRCLAPADFDRVLDGYGRAGTDQGFLLLEMSNGQRHHQITRWDRRMRHGFSTAEWAVSST